MNAKTTAGNPCFTKQPGPEPLRGNSLEFTTMFVFSDPNSLGQLDRHSQAKLESLLASRWQISTTIALGDRQLLILSRPLQMTR